jgi:hypothetical protein
MYTDKKDHVINILSWYLYEDTADIREPQSRYQISLLGLRSSTPPMGPLHTKK